MDTTSTSNELAWRQLTTPRLVPVSRWGPVLFSQVSSSSYGSFVGGKFFLETRSFNISASQAHKMDPQNLLLLDVSFTAGSSRNGNNVGVYVGMLTQPIEGVVASNPVYSPTHASTASGLISYTLGLTGACLTLDTACSTQLVGAHLARAEI